MRRDTVYHLVFDGLSDWEAALALAEINQSEDYAAAAVGLTAEPVTTAAGLRIRPDGALDTVEAERAAAVVVPGGARWEQEGSGTEVASLLGRVHAAGAVVAAVCGGTLVAARAGLLDERCHTSNMPGYIDGRVPGYGGAGRYESEQLAVTDGRVVTASGVGGVEFARELLRELGVYEGDELSAWFGLFKHGVVPEQYSA